MGNGMTTAGVISGYLDRADILRGVLTEGFALSNVVSLLDQVDVPNLDGSIPIYHPGGADEDLDELETSDINGGHFTNVVFNLKKDRVKLAASDEAKFRSRGGDPLQIQISGAGQDLADKLDKKTIAAFDTSPQTGAASAPWSTTTNSIYYDLTTAIQACKPYKANFIVMAEDTFSAYCQNETLLKLSYGSPSVLAGAVGRVPGLGLDIFTDSRVTSGAAFVGASKYCAILGKGPAKIGTTDDRNAGAVVYVADVWRQVKAPIYKNASGLNKALYKITGLV
jgi:hypothetical protein